MSKALQYSQIQLVYIALKATNVTMDNLNLVDIGDLHMRVNGREYHVDYLDYSLSLDGDTIEFQATTGTFEDAQECFEDGKFDLTEEDLANPELLTTVYLDSPDKNIGLEFISGEIYINFKNSDQDHVVINHAEQDQGILMIRTLTFEQISDSRFSGSKLELEENSRKIIRELSALIGITVKVEEIRELEFTNPDTQEKSISWRQRFFIKKTGRKTTWNDVYRTVNETKAVPYDFTVQRNAFFEPCAKVA